MLAGFVGGVCQGARPGQDVVGDHARRAQQYLAAKQPAKAIPELEAVVRLDPKNVEARANLGVLLYFQGRYAEAVPQLRGAVEAQAGLVKIAALLGMAERRTGDEAGGRADLERVFPDIGELKLKTDVGKELIESYAAADELEKASDTVAALLKLQPTDASLLYTSYRIHSQMAVAALLELGLAAPDSAQTHQAMAHELQRDRDLAGTIANLRRALALDPALPGSTSNWRRRCMRRTTSGCGRRRRRSTGWRWRRLRRMRRRRRGWGM